MVDFDRGGSLTQPTSGSGGETHIGPSKASTFDPGIGLRYQF
jgi:hypothetical protein